MITIYQAVLQNSF